VSDEKLLDESLTSRYLQVLYHQTLILTNFYVGLTFIRYNH